VAKTSEEIYDRACFAALVDDVGEETSRAALRLFFSDTGARLDRMGGGDGAGDVEVVQRFAHTVKSSAATFGFNHLSSLARRLEHDTAHLASVDLAARIDELRSALAAVRMLIAGRDELT
jgi:HPt (histidine-containing phosphotransfer) domain-containing protein